MLLTVVKGPMSFEDLCTYDGVVHQNFKSACIACGLLDSDEQWDHSLMEAELWQGGFQSVIDLGGPWACLGVPNLERPRHRGTHGHAQLKYKTE